MKPDKEKEGIREPVPPEHTPHPPQIIDPTSDKERREKAAPLKGQKNKRNKDKRGSK